MSGADAVRATRPAHPPRTPLAQVAGLLESLGEPVTWHGARPEGVDVTGVTLSTARVLPGDLYAALPGARAHGASYAEQAHAAGAVAVLTDPAGADLLGPVERELPVLVVEGPRRVLGTLAASLYGDPASRLRLVGVTGTQGKTTTTRLLEGALSAAGRRAAVIGTNGTRVAGEEVRTSLTTPESPDLQGLFALMAEREVETCAMEVSSHALTLGRVDGVRFDVAVFLNLGRDHLDFHATVEEYFEAKASLFTPARCRLGIVDVDDDHGRRLAERLRGEPDVVLRTLSTRGAEADWTAHDVEPGPSGSTFTVRAPDGTTLEAWCPLPGAYNVANAVAALAAAAEAGHDLAEVADGLARVPGVPGRLERVEGGDVHVLVDYAHKPDAVEAALSTLRPLTTGRLLAVIGAGGDRDTGKRPVMGEIAARLADVVVVTDDNPRSEDPAAIRAAVLAGAREAAAGGGADVREEGDRRAAIALACDLAAPGDIVVVLGKGHETGQTVAGVVHPFDDRVVAAEEAARAAAARGGA